jgi:hypothetical protein
VGDDASRAWLRVWASRPTRPQVMTADTDHPAPRQQLAPRGQLVSRAGHVDTDFDFADGRRATLALLFTFSSPDGQLGFEASTETVPGNGNIEWEDLMGTGPTVNKARRFNSAPQHGGRRHERDWVRLRAWDSTVEQGFVAFPTARNRLRRLQTAHANGQAVAKVLAPGDLASPRPVPQDGFLADWPVSAS